MIRSTTMAALTAICAAGLATSARAEAACVGAPGAGRVRLDVVATGVRNTAGEVAFTVYPDDRGRFLAKGGKLARARVPAASPATRACFWLPVGYYALATYHDENGDHAFNRSLIAVKEGFGFSNDATATLGLPSFGATRFAVRPAGTTIAIRTRYRR